jgi:hypothetical protein
MNVKTSVIKGTAKRSTYERTYEKASPKPLPLPVLIFTMDEIIVINDVSSINLPVPEAKK